MATGELKLERLLNLTALLVDAGRPIAADEVHRQIFGYPERPDSFRRAFERDKDELREMGIRIEVEPLLGGDANQVGYIIPSAEFHLQDPGLSIEERMALQLALSMVRLSGPIVEGVDPLAKLGGREQGVAAVDPVAELSLTPALGAVFEAIIERQELAFDYRGGPRHVQPYRLDFERGRWYLTGLDVDRGAQRCFRLDRVDGAVSAGTRAAFEPPEHIAGVKLQPWRFGDEEPVIATLAVDDDAAPAVRDLLGPDAEWTSAGGDAWTVTVEVRDRNAFRSAVVSLLDAVEVMGPPEVRDDVIAWLDSMIDDVPAAPDAPVGDSAGDSAGGRSG